MIFFVKVRDLCTKTVPVVCRCALSVFRDLFDGIELINQVVLHKPCVIIINITTSPTLFGQHHFIKTNIQVGWSKMHFPYRSRSITGIPQ